MNAPKGLTAVMLMLCVRTPGDPMTARAKMDFLEMELTALVSTKTSISLYFGIMRYSNT